MSLTLRLCVLLRFEFERQLVDLAGELERNIVVGSGGSEMAKSAEVTACDEVMSAHVVH